MPLILLYAIFCSTPVAKPYLSTLSAGDEPSSPVFPVTSVGARSSAWSLQDEESPASLVKTGTYEAAFKAAIASLTAVTPSSVVLSNFPGSL